MARRILLLCYGNPARLDDGLGPAFAAAVEERWGGQVSVHTDYQLAVEDACSVSEHDLVIFVDASMGSEPPFTFQQVEPDPRSQFSSHLVEPGNLLYLAKVLFGAEPEAYCLGIRGYDFDDFGERLSLEAERNLGRSLEFFHRRVIMEGSLESA